MLQADQVLLLHAQMLFTATASVVIHNFWDVEDQNTQLLEMIMFFKVRPTLLNTIKQ